MLKEIDYNKIFNAKTIASLKGQSGDSLKKLWGNKNLRQALTNNAQLLYKVIAVEEPYKDNLAQLAIEIVKQVYPIIDYAGIEINAQITGPEDLQLPNDSQQGEDEEISDEVPESIKRRIINGITQGASIRGAYTFLLFKDKLDELNPELLNDYKELLNLTFGTFDSDEAVAMMLAMLANGAKQEGGISEADYNEETGVLTINAKALCFPYLVHEIVKGIYEIISLQGFGTDKEKNKQIVQATDKLSNEPLDSQYGKFIFDAINNVYIYSEYDDSRIRDFLFTEIYKLDDQDFMSFIENAINGALTRQQQSWANNIMRDISRDLTKDDSGLDDLG